MAFLGVFPLAHFIALRNAELLLQEAAAGFASLSGSRQKRRDLHSSIRFNISALCLSIGV
jgi:hypothetical protein